ncbi:hypothetical protein HDC94_002912 [Leifsonia sp. AK011]|uniref:hypothetical protein n=1 Tax=Leifsonia sp. AK011 TaxID=2723075 RepID=UPI0015C87210|nr:hypothetical protein [Leifsonia sp. AK011]NYF11705.1 hypothetical protein [Leifsonia sp. AK011]
MTRTTQRSGWAAIALTAGLLLTLGTAVPATAHEGPIELEFDQDGRGGVTLLARYVEDGHPVTEIIDPVATAIAADGSSLDPVKLVSAPEGQGVWVSPEPFLEPGFWTVTVTVTTPSPASSTVNMEVVVSDDAPPASTDDTGDAGWLLWAAGGASVVLIGLLVALLVVRSRRKTS